MFCCGTQKKTSDEAVPVLETKIQIAYGCQDNESYFGYFMQIDADFEQSCTIAKGKSSDINMVSDADKVYSLCKRILVERKELT